MLTYTLERSNKIYILGITSLWLVVPVVLGVGEDSVCPVAHMALVMWTAVVCGVSTGTYWFMQQASPSPGVWTDHRGKMMHRADRICAPVMFVALALFFAMDCACAQHVEVMPVVVLTFYVSSRFFEVVYPHVAAATCCHLIFRYAGYWWVYIALADVSPMIFTLNSLVYWGHIRWSLERHDYVAGCLEVLTLALLMSLVNTCLPSAPRLLPSDPNAVWGRSDARLRA